MRLLRLAARNLKQRPLTSVLTTVSIMFGAALVSFLWLVAGQAERRYVTSSRGFNVVIGPKESSTLDLVLSTIYMIKPAQGVIPLSVYKELHSDTKKWGRHVRCAIPVASGDSYRGFPIVATSDEWFKVFGRPKPSWKTNRPPEMRFAAGKEWDFTHEELLAEAKFQEHLKEPGGHEGHDHGHGDIVPEKWRKVVIGAGVAREIGLSLGSKIVPAHGVGDASLHHHDEAECEVVGVLEPLGTPIDRTIYMPLGAFWRLKGHEAIGSTTKNQYGDVEISAVLLNTRPPIGFQHVRRAFGRRIDGIAALPETEIRSLFKVVGNIALALRTISFVVLWVASIGVFLALYSTMSERRRDVAIMRSLGARRLQIFGIVVFEAVLITATGAVLGVGLAHAIAQSLSGWLLAETGVPMSGVAFGIEELWLILGVTVLGGVAGYLPAYQASRTDVARYLSPDR
ncbi:MAG: hypothetical protein CMJ85_09885 [Planctomycetes bacterium]|nr:hypothetical protein [Planctomycetota bacterium]MDP6424316.1 ABC transporter permease [Planctomycetota bacterium]